MGADRRVDDAPGLSRRELLHGAIAVAGHGALVATLGAPATRARAQDAGAEAAAPMPVAFVAHGSPSLAYDPARRRPLRAWGRALPTPRGVLALTPHYRARRIELGHVGRGHALYSFPPSFLPRVRGMTYDAPDNSLLAARVEAALADRYPVSRATDRSGLDHTTWMPLRHLRPAADVPVLELALPFVPDEALFELGRALAPLRDEGVLLLCSGNLVHNLAASEPASAPARWATRFDAWVVERLARHDLDALVRWRRAAPEPYLAHPDDGGHYDVLLVGLGAIAEASAARPARYPETGFAGGSLSLRCAEIG